MENPNKPFQQVFTPEKQRDYRQDLTELKANAVSLIDRMMAFDPTFPNEQKMALSLAVKLLNHVEEVCKEHLSRPIPQEKELKFEGLDLVVQKVKDWKRSRAIGGNTTVLGMKNPNSYMIGTTRQEIILIEEGVQLYSGKPPVEEGAILDIVYSAPLNCYFMAHDYRLYQKYIDNRPGHLFIDVEPGMRPGSCFICSQISHRMIFNKRDRNLLVIDAKRKKIETEFEEIKDQKISHFKVFGKKEDRIISVTERANLVLYSLDYAQKRGVIAHHQLELMSSREEEAMTLAVCSKNKYLVVEIAGWQNHSRFSSRMLVFQINEDRLVNTACLDKFSLKIQCKLDLECYGYSGKHLLLVGLWCFRNGMVQMYDFDTEKGELRELEEKRVDHKEKYPSGLIRSSDKFYYTGWDGKLMSLSLGN